MPLSISLLLPFLRIYKSKLTMEFAFFFFHLFLNLYICDVGLAIWRPSPFYIIYMVSHQSNILINYKGINQLILIAQFPTWIGLFIIETKSSIFFLTVYKMKQWRKKKRFWSFTLRVSMLESLFYPKVE